MAWARTPVCSDERTAESKSVHAMGCRSAMSKYGPTAQSMAVTHQWGACCTKVAQRLFDAGRTPGSVWGVAHLASPGPFPVRFRLMTHAPRPGL